MAEFTNLVEVTLWLIELHYGKQCKKKHFFGPVDSKSNPTRFILELDKDQYILFLPYPDISYSNLSAKEAYHQAAIQDETILKCIFVTPLDLKDNDKIVLSNVFEGKKEFEIWDSKWIQQRFACHIGIKETELGKNDLDLKRAHELVEAYKLKNNNKPESLTLTTSYGKSLQTLLQRFSFENSIRILKGAKEHNTDDLFSTDEYSLTKDPIVLVGDIKNFTSLMDRATKKRNPSKFGEYLRKWYEEVVEILKKYDAFLDKFMGDGFLAFFGYPFMDDKQETLKNVFECACELINKTEEILFIKYVKKIFPELINSNTGYLRLGISSGELYTLPTSTISQSPYQQFLILGNPIIEATRIESLVEPNKIGVDLETFEEFKKAIPRIEKGGKKVTENIKRQKISFFQIEP